MADVPMIDWRPMSELPPFDRDVLVCDVDDVVFTAFLAEAYPFVGRPGSWAVHVSYNNDCECPIKAERLRYWAHLPAAPSTEAGHG